jgi:hypothetical protein
LRQFKKIEIDEIWLQDEHRKERKEVPVQQEEINAQLFKRTNEL